MSQSPGPSRRRIILAGLVGNVMEWYDFAVYGYFASVIGHQFFPAADPATSLIAAFGAFAAGFLVRPIGGLVFGRIGDLVGRQRALTLSVLTMALPTVLIAVLPTYATLGFAAPVLLVSLRIIQGLSVGGEYTGSLVFLVEHAPPNGRAFSAVWGAWGATAGILLGSGVGDVLARLLTEEQITSWGWRLPFLMGILVAGTGYLVRRSIHADKPTAESKSPENLCTPRLTRFSAYHSRSFSWRGVHRFSGLSGRTCSAEWSSIFSRLGCMGSNGRHSSRFRSRGRLGSSPY